MLLLLTACRSGTLQPASIEPGDICAYCKMAISQAGYTAQFIDKDGTAFQFDDIGCMIRFTRENSRRDTVAEFFVMDHNDKRWLSASQAIFVKSEQTASPMASGLTAFGEAARAQNFAAKSKGRILHFDDLWLGDAALPAQYHTK
jgi:copper chaperone NosL